MLKLTTHLTYILLLAVAIIIIFADRSCSRQAIPPPPKSGSLKTTVKDSLVYHHDTIRVAVKGQNIVMTKFVNLPVPAHVDTAAILSRFYEQFVYVDNIADSNLKGSITDTISRNIIVGRGFSYVLLRPDHYITKTVTQTIEKRNKWLRICLGASIAATKDRLTGIEPQVGFMARNDAMLQFGYNILDRSLLFGVLIKIRFR
jgi:hypothetical protein